MARRPEKLVLPAGRQGVAWVYRLPRTFPRRVHRHRELEFNLVTRGTASYLLDDRRVDLSPGTLLWLFPAQDHVLINESPDFAMWILVFKPELLERVCTGPASAPLKLQRPVGVACKRLSNAAAGRLAALAQELTGAADDQLFDAGLAYLLLSARAAHQAADELPGRADVHPAVERAAHLIRDERDPMKIAELARRSGLSASRLSRLFKQQTGVSLVAYRQRQRLERFLDLYGKGRRTGMHEAALCAGFGSYPQFHRVFKQHMGIGPADHRRRLT